VVVYRTNSIWPICLYAWSVMTSSRSGTLTYPTTQPMISALHMHGFHPSAEVTSHVHFVNSFYQSVVFFHNKLVNNNFSHDFLEQRTISDPTRHPHSALSTQKTDSNVWSKHILAQTKGKKVLHLCTLGKSSVERPEPRCIPAQTKGKKILLNLSTLGKFSVERPEPRSSLSLPPHLASHPALLPALRPPVSRRGAALL